MGEILVYGVEHYDETLPERIPKQAPEDTSIVYHESVEDPHDGLFGFYLRCPPTLPHHLMIAVSNTVSDTGWSRTSCERAAKRLADERGLNDPSRIGKPVRERAQAFSLFESAVGWLAVLAYVWIVYEIAIRSVLVAVGALFLLMVWVAGFGWYISNRQHGHREAYMADCVSGNPPDEGTGVAIVGDDHHEPIAERLRAEGIDAEGVSLVSN